MSQGSCLALHRDSFGHRSHEHHDHVETKKAHEGTGHQKKHLLAKSDAADHDETVYDVSGTKVKLVSPELSAGHDGNVYKVVKVDEGFFTNNESEAALQVVRSKEGEGALGRS